MNAQELIQSAPKTVRELLSLRGWDSFQESKLGNDLFISDPDRADRIHEAASEGCDGSTHAEHIEDWREFSDQVYSDVRSQAWKMELSDEDSSALDEAIDNAESALGDDIDACEQYHETAGTLHDQIG